MMGAVIGLMLSGTLLCIVGCVYFIQRDKELRKEETEHKKEFEIENTSADDLIAGSHSAERHKRNKDKLRREFRADADKLLDDFLRRANKASGCTNPESGRTEN